MNRRVKRNGPVVATCVSCGWSATASTWRPARRQLAAHAAQLHSPAVGK